MKQKIFVYIVFFVLRAHKYFTVTVFYPKGWSKPCSARMHKVIKREEKEKYLSWFPIFLVISGSGSPSGPVNLSFSNLEKNWQ
jgi:hypothetical protein